MKVSVLKKDNFAKSVATCIAISPITNVLVLLVKGTSRCQISCFGNDLPIVSISTVRIKKRQK